MKTLELLVPTYIANLRTPSTLCHENAERQEVEEPIIIQTAGVDRPIGSGTLNGDGSSRAEEISDFSEPNVPVLVCEADGVRIVLGSHRYDDYSKPDIQIERRPNGWAIFLHAFPRRDPSGYLYFLDDGRSFLVKGHGLSGAEQIQVLEPDDDVPEPY